MSDAATLPKNLNLNVRGLGLSATLAINERSAALKAEGRPVHRFGLGQSPFPVPERLQKALCAHAHEKDYLAVAGLPALREAFAAYLTRTRGVAFAGEDVLIGPGTKELMFLIQLTYYGDLVIPTPSWVSYAPQADIIGRRIRWLRTEIGEGEGVTPQALDRLCRNDPERPRLLILNSPGNPTGLAYDDEQLAAIAQAARTYKILVLSDEIYSGVQFEGAHASIAKHYPEGTIISDGLSKWCGAGGWRLGGFAFPPQLRWLRDAVAVTASETYTSVSAPIQHAAVEGFEDHPDLADYVDRSRRVLKAVAAHVYEGLQGAEATLNPLRGGFYAFPVFEGEAKRRLKRRGMRTCADVAARLLEDTGVAALPSQAFGCTPDTMGLRLAFVDFDGAAALEAAPEDGVADEDWLRAHAPSVADGIAKLRDWALMDA